MAWALHLQLATIESQLSEVETHLRYFERTRNPRDAHWWSLALWWQSSLCEQRSSVALQLKEARWRQTCREVLSSRRTEQLRQEPAPEPQILSKGFAEKLTLSELQNLADKPASQLCDCTGSPCRSTSEPSVTSPSLPEGSSEAETISLPSEKSPSRSDTVGMGDSPRKNDEEDVAPCQQTSAAAVSAKDRPSKEAIPCGDDDEKVVFDLSHSSSSCEGNEGRWTRRLTTRVLPHRQLQKLAKSRAERVRSLCTKVKRLQCENRELLNREACARELACLEASQLFQEKLQLRESMVQQQERLLAAEQERDQLLASRITLATELRNALAAADSAKSRLKQEVQEERRAKELQRQQLEEKLQSAQAAREAMEKDERATKEVLLQIRGRAVELKERLSFSEKACEVLSDEKQALQALVASEKDRAVSLVLRKLAPELHPDKHRNSAPQPRGQPLSSSRRTFCC